MYEGFDPEVSWVVSDICPRRVVLLLSNTASYLKQETLFPSCAAEWTERRSAASTANNCGTHAECSRVRIYLESLTWVVPA